VAEIFTGVVIVMIIALLVETALVRIGRWMMPWNVQKKNKKRITVNSPSLVGEQ
jgi:ABC-type proline/glycine betaine transport system permease subunit